jgi:hypothetical protein
MFASKVRVTKKRNSPAIGVPCPNGSLPDVSGRVSDCPVCLDGNHDHYPFKISNNRVAVQPDSFEGDVELSNCTVVGVGTKFIGQQAVCHETASCNKSVGSSEDNSATVTENFYCFSDSMQAGCSGKNWADCLMDPHFPVLYKFNKCLKDSASDVVDPGCSTQRDFKSPRSSGQPAGTIQ